MQAIHMWEGEINKLHAGNTMGPRGRLHIGTTKGGGEIHVGNILAGARDKHSL
jgi:hypothetical protein